MVKYTDATILDRGRYKGSPLSEVPAHWFIWMKDLYGIDSNSQLGVYINENIDAIRERNEKENKND